MTTIINILKNKFEKNIFLNENLSKYSWFNLGGNAEIFFRAENKVQLASFLKEINVLYDKINIVGAGSNTLFRDGGVKGITIKLSSNFSFVKLLDENTIVAGGATLDKKVSDFATENGLSGLEFLSCIPGSVGGAIRMNSGCYGEETSRILESIKVINIKGEEYEIKKNELSFFYRGCSLAENLVIVSARFNGKKLNKNIIKKKQMQLINKKKESQPSQIKTCGSTFKNTDTKKAWELIKESNCKSMSVGDASISEKHYNFFVNNGNANASDIETLINQVKKEVLKKTGIDLELEIKITGTKK